VAGLKVLFFFSVSCDSLKRHALNSNSCAVADDTLFDTWLTATTPGKYRDMPWYGVKTWCTQVFIICCLGTLFGVIQSFDKGYLVNMKKLSIIFPVFLL